MNTIETLISEARERQIAQTNAWRARKEQDALNAAERLHDDFCRVFGEDLSALLNASADCEIDSSAHIRFAYQGRDYSLRVSSYEGVAEWYLTRLDPRADDDERRRPSVSFTEYRRDEQHNRDALLLALSDLDQEPNVPWPVRDATPEPAPRVMNEFEANLLDALRQYLQSEL